MLKKAFVMLAVLGGFAVAHASEEVSTPAEITEENAAQLRSEYEYDMQVMSAEDAVIAQMEEAQRRPDRRGDARRDNRRDDRRDRRNDDWRRRGPRFPIPFPVPRYERWICYSRNARGQVFSGTARNQRAAYAIADRRCESASRFACRPAGCRRF